MAAIGFWTDDRVTALVAFHAAGFSCRVIGEMMGASRNAIIGRIYRMGLSPPVVKKAAAPKKKREKRSTASHDQIIHRIVRANGNSNQMRVFASIQRNQYKLRCVEIECLTTFEDLTGCRYPVGDGPFLFCNGPRMEGKSYCLNHAALCFQPPRILTDKAPLREVA